MLSSTNIGVSGLMSSMTSLEALSNNISNANTVGFKSSFATYLDSYTSNSQTGDGQRIGGVMQNFGAGGLQATGRTLDLSIGGGDGFFVQKDSATGGVSYTRAGQFDIDQNGTLFSTLTGKNIQGFEAQSGVLTSIQSDLQIPSAPMAAKASAGLDINLNLDSSAEALTNTFSPTDASTYSYRSDSVVYDSLGNQNNVATYYRKTGDNAWSVIVQDGDANTLAAGAATFGSNGALNAVTGLDAVAFTGGGGSAAQTLAFDFAGSTQTALPSSTNSTGQDGFAAGTVTGFAIDIDGQITTSYSNMQTEVVGKVAIAKFAAPGQLENLGEMSWQASNTSGAASVELANSDGVIDSGYLELSNVDLTSQLVELMNAQRTFQANAQSIKTSDQLSETIIGLVR